MIIKRALQQILVVAIAAFFALPAFAQTTVEKALLDAGTPTNKLLTFWGTQANLGTIAGRIIGFIMGFLGIVTVILILYAGFLYLTAAGEEEKTKQALKLLNQALIGLIIILCTWAIAYFVLNAIVTATKGTP